MAEIRVALDSPRERNIAFFPGDDVIVNVTVYAKDGDTVPVTVTDVELVYGGRPTSINTGDYFTAAFCQRTRYRLQGTYLGHKTTLAFGVISSPLGNDHSCCIDDYGWCVCGVLIGGASSTIPANAILDNFGNPILDDSGKPITG